MPWVPAVSVLLPVLDEAEHLTECLESIAAQDYTGPVEVLVIDGGSTDDTIPIAESFADRLDLRIVPNPDRVQSLGCNRGAAVATGELLCRMDGHTVYAADYVRRSVAQLETTDAAAVGGRQTPVGANPWSRAFAVAMTSPLATGPSAFRHATEPTWADTVYLGTFRRQDLLAVGGYRHLPSGVAEEADLYWRLRRRGGRILVDPAIRSEYRPRDTLRGWLRQNYRYGKGKAEFLYANRTLPSWRPLVPAVALVVVLALAVLAGVTARIWPLVAVVTLGVAVASGAAVAGRSRGAGFPRSLIAVTTMPAAYGLGLLAGLLVGPGPVRRSLAETARV
jgi:succinoglycan biosynthesis protein ExoA